MSVKHIDVYNTHIELYPYEKDDIPIIEEMYTATEKFTNKEFPCGYTIEDNKLFLPRGTSISKLERLTDVKARYYLESDGYEKMGYNHSSFYDPRNEIQEESIKFLCGSEHQLGLNLATGVGKGLPLNTKIPTPNGYKLMGDIEVGDTIFTIDGTTTNVVGVYDQGIRNIYKITFNDGRSSICDENHLWLVKTHTTGVYHPKQTSDMFNDFKRYDPNMKKSSANRDPYVYKYMIPTMRGPVEYNHRDVPIHPYVLGALIGNGCLKEKLLSISSGNTYVPNRIGKLYNIYPMKNKANYTYIFYKSNESNSRVQTQDFFKDIPDLISTNSSTKFIPDIYIYNDIDTRIQLLQGLMDTDGSISRSDGRYHVTYSSCSKTLLTQIQFILKSLGFNASIIQDKRVEKYHNGYHATLLFQIPNELKMQFFTIPYKFDIALEASYLPDTNITREHLKIKNIEYIGKTETRCIKVDHPSHLFITEDFIVTHNTYCVAYAITQLSIKAIIVTPNEMLKQQWIGTFNKMFDYRPKHLMNIAGSNIMDAIMEDLVEEADVYFVNHQTLRSYLMQHGGYQFHQFFKKLNIGIKVYDESHMEFANILMIDFFTNTDRTWYLTATFDRSDKTESQCFKRAFNSVICYGEMESKSLTPKHVIYHVVNFDSRISPKNRAKMLAYPGYSSNRYGQYAFGLDPNDTAYKVIREILLKLKDIEGKTLIFVPLIENVDTLVSKIKHDFPEKSCAAYHSKIPKDEKEDAEKKDIIVSTIKSCGTGRDIKGLRSVICAEPVASKVIAEQMIGRLRPYGEGKDTFFFDTVDNAIMQNGWFWKARFKKIQTLVKEVKYLNMDAITFQE